MKELHEYTYEIRQRVEDRRETRRRNRKRAVAIGVPLALCLVVGALTLPRALRRQGTKEAPEGRSEAVLTAPEDALDGAWAGADGAALPAGEDMAPPPNQQSGGQTDGVADGEMEFTETKLQIPADFNFRFVWNCYGVSSYDSRTGELVKTTDSTHPADYVTTLVLTDQQRAEVWALLSELELETYPGTYDPYNDPKSDNRVASEPNRDLILTLWANGAEKTVTCRKICLGGPGLQGYDEKARAFLEACNRLTRLIEQTPEWEALPDWEFYYE